MAWWIGRFGIVIGVYVEILGGPICIQKIKKQPKTQISVKNTENAKIINVPPVKWAVRIITKSQPLAVQTSNEKYI